MATVNISYDTNTKVADVSINNQTVENVREVVLFPDFEDETKKSIEIIMMEEVKEEGIRIRTCVEASENKKILDLDQFDEDSITKGVCQMLGKKY